MGKSDATHVEMAVARKLHDDLMAGMPEGARHDRAICQFCIAQDSAASDPSGSGRPGVIQENSSSTEGGTNPTMADISQEAHEALLKKAVEEAVKTTEAALQAKIEEAAQATSKVSELEKEKAELTTETERLNKDLDAAQVQLTSATDQVKSLTDDIAKKEEDTRLAEVASKRSDQVKNLKLFPDEYVAEKASKWAAFDEAAWSEQLEEWKQLKPAAPEAEKATDDKASAMSGTSEDLTKEKPVEKASDETPARRAVLGLA